MIVSLWWCMDVCACVIVLYLIFVFLFVMIVLLHFMRNKLNIIDLFCHDGLEISDDSLVISDAVFHVILLNRLALPDTHDRCGAYGYRCSVVCVSVGHNLEPYKDGWTYRGVAWCSVLRSACMYVCPRVYLKNQMSKFREILCPYCSILFWWHFDGWDTLCTSGFVDDVISVQSAR